jgi:WD40 repeat protein
MMFYLIQIQQKYILVVKIGKYEYGKIQCKNIYYKNRNGKNKVIKAHSGSILKLSLSRDEDFLISCSSDKTIKMWNIEGIIY